LTAQNWHTKRFFRGIPNTKVVSICLTNKTAYILNVSKDVHIRLQTSMGCPFPTKSLYSHASWGYGINVFFGPDSIDHKNGGYPLFWDPKKMNTP